LADARPITLDVVPAAKLLGIHPETLKKQAASGEVPGAKCGRKWVFIEADLLSHIRAKYAPKVTLPCLQRSKGSTSANPAASGTSTSITLGIGYVAQLDNLITRRPKRSATTSS
jgi:excisionase family DNA binding protein